VTAGLRARASRLWADWVSLWDGEEDPRVLATIRIAIALVMAYDLVYLYQIGLVETLFAPQEAGGLGDVMGRKPPPEAYVWLGGTAQTAWLLWAICLGAIACFGAGLLMPLAGLVFVLAYAQLAWALPLGDRGIDMMIRNVVLILSFSGANRAWGLDALLFGRRERVPSWPRYLLVLQIAVMYAMAGVQKTAVTWTPLGGYAALYIVLQDPSIARHSFAWLDAVYPLTQLATAATMIFEYGAVLVPLSFWWRKTRTRGGWLRAQSNRFRWVRGWMAIGVLLHLGIAATMSLGIFPWAMLALYPAFLSPAELGLRGGRTDAIGSRA
jgi:hypothetical protein